MVGVSVLPVCPAHCRAQRTGTYLPFIAANPVFALIWYFVAVETKAIGRESHISRALDKIRSLLTPQWRNSMRPVLHPQTHRIACPVPCRGICTDSIRSLICLRRSGCRQALKGPECTAKKRRATEPVGVNSARVSDGGERYLRTKTCEGCPLGNTKRMYICISLGMHCIYQLQRPMETGMAALKLQRLQLRCHIIVSRHHCISPGSIFLDSRVVYDWDRGRSRNLQSPTLKE